MLKKLFIVFSMVSVVGVIFGIAVIPRLMPFLSGSSGHAGSHLDYVDAETLVQRSERILIAKYLNEKSHVVDKTNAYDGTVLGDITLIVQRFQNIEVLKGDAPVGDMTFVALVSSDSLDKPDGEKMTSERETVQLSVDDNYVLFLREVPPRPEYKGQYGDVVWAYVGEPGIAQIQPDTGNLEFKVTDRFKSERDVLSVSNAPFELSKEEILALVSSGSGGK